MADPGLIAALGACATTIGGAILGRAQIAAVEMSIKALSARVDLIESGARSHLGALAALADRVTAIERAAVEEEREDMRRELAAVTAELKRLGARRTSA